MKVEFELRDVDDCVNVIKAIQATHQTEVTIGESGKLMYIQQIKPYNNSITIVTQEYKYA